MVFREKVTHLSNNLSIKYCLNNKNNDNLRMCKSTADLFVVDDLLNYCRLEFLKIQETVPSTVSCACRVVSEVIKLAAV